MANWSQISGTLPQYDKTAAAGSGPASGYYLKFYNTSNVAINMASDKDGGGLLAKCQLDSSGYPLNGSSARFIPYINQDYRIALYTNSTDADADTTGNADFFPVTTPVILSSNSDVILSKTLAEAIADTTAVVGKNPVMISDRGNSIWDYVLASGVTPNTFNIIQCTGVATLALVLRIVHYKVEEWGIVGDDSTDNSLAEQAICDAAGTNGLVLFGPGTFRGNFSTSASLKGTGSRDAILKTATTGTPVVTLTGNAVLWNFRSIKDLDIDGALGAVTKDSDGITFADTGAGDEFNGRWVFDGVWFKDCDKAMVKPTGNIGNTFRNCGFHQGNYGYYAKDVDAPLIMQGSNDDFYKCEWHSQATAAVYVDSDTAVTGQTTFNDCIFENTLGMTVFIKNFKTAYNPLTFNNCWWESNARTGSVTIDTIAYTPQDLWIRGCRTAILRGCNVESITADTDGIVVLEKCFLNENTAFTKVDFTSSIIALDCYTGGVKAVGAYTENSIGFTRDTGAAADVLVTKPRSIVASATNNNYTLISSQDFSNEEAYTWSGTASLTGRSAPDGVLFNSCCEITVPTAHSQFGTSTGGTITAGKYIVWTVDIKPTTADIAIVNVLNGVTAATGLDAFLTQNEWTSLAGLAQVTAGAGGTIGFNINNTTGSNSTFRVSAWQLVEFTDIQDAISFYRSGIYVSDKQRRVFYGEAAPTTGTWAIGDRLYHTTPSAAGTMGWVCTTAGTPGTWKTFGAITA